MPIKKCSSGCWIDAKRTRWAVAVASEVVLEREQEMVEVENRNQQVE